MAALHSHEKLPRIPSGYMVNVTTEKYRWRLASNRYSSSLIKGASNSERKKPCCGLQAAGGWVHGPGPPGALWSAPGKSSQTESQACPGGQKICGGTGASTGLCLGSRPRSTRESAVPTAQNSGACPRHRGTEPPAKSRGSEGCWCPVQGVKETSAAQPPPSSPSAEAPIDPCLPHRP